MSENLFSVSTGIELATLHAATDELAIEVATRWPADWNGIIAWYPAWKQMSAMLAGHRASRALARPGAYPNTPKRKIVQDAALQACDGLARAIEQSTEEPLPATESAAKIGALCAQYTGALGSFGLKTGDIDTLVLGCTHYVFAKDALRALVGPEVQILDTGAAVARQTRRILAQAGALAHAATEPGQITLYTTGQLAALQAAAGRWLQLPARCCAELSGA